MNSAIVLGDEESMEWIKGQPQTVFYKKVDIPDWANNQMTLDDFMEEE